MQVCFICSKTLPDPDGSSLAWDSHMAFQHGLVAAHRKWVNGRRVDSSEAYCLVSPLFSLKATLPDQLPRGPYEGWNMQVGDWIEPALEVKDQCDEDGCILKRQPEQRYCPLHSGRG